MNKNKKIFHRRVYTSMLDARKISYQNENRIT